MYQCPYVSNLHYPHVKKINGKSNKDGHKSVLIWKKNDKSIRHFRTLEFKMLNKFRRKVKYREKTIKKKKI